MHTRQRLLTAIGIAALVVVVGYALADLTAYRTAGSIVWTVFGVVPFLAVGVWLVRRSPEHLQAQRLLLLGWRSPSALRCRARCAKASSSHHRAGGFPGSTWSASTRPCSR